jgi:iron complex outermembrane receptor protein
MAHKFGCSGGQSMMARAHMCFVAGLTIVACSGYALAQERAPSPEKAQVGNLEEVIVTAERRNELLIDVPISITVLGEERFNEVGATNFLDVADLIPNFQLSETPSGTTARDITIRGIGAFPRNVGVDTGLEFYLDGVSLGRNGAYNLDLEGVERVEVLRGPQGTLYGRNVIAGAVNYVTKKPNATFAGDADVKYTDYDQYQRVGGSVNIPITDSVFLRASGAEYGARGFIRNAFTGSIVDGNHGKTGRLQLRTIPSDRLTVDLSFDALNEHNGLAGLQPISGPYATPPNIVNVNLPSSERRTLLGASATVEYKLGGGFELTSISAWRRQLLFEQEDGDFLPLDILTTPEYRVNEDEFSQELRLTSPTGGRLDYVTGLYYFHAKDAGVISYYYPGAAPFIVTNHGPDYTYAKIPIDSYAAFGQANIHVTSRLTLTAGARYNVEKKDIWYLESGTSDFCCLFPASFYPVTRSRSDSVPTWTGSVAYKLNGNNNLYATISRGFKPGGFNADSGINPALPFEFKPEFVTNYEIGVKSSVYDGRVQFDFDAFTLRYRDLQTAVLIPPDYNFAAAINAGHVTASGVELDFALRPLGRLLLIGGGSYTNGYYAQFDSGPLLGGDVSGNKLPNLPRWTGNLTSDYTVPLPYGHLSFIVNGNTRAFMFNNHRNDRTTPSRTLLGARVGYSSPENRWSVFVFGTNLTDKLYEISNNHFLKTTFTSYGPPRAIGVEGQVSF